MKNKQQHAKSKCKIKKNIIQTQKAQIHNKCKGDEKQCKTHANNMNKFNKKKARPATHEKYAKTCNKYKTNASNAKAYKTHAEHTTKQTRAIQQKIAVIKLAEKIMKRINVKTIKKHAPTTCPRNAQQNVPDTPTHANKKTQNKENIHKV